MSRRTLAGFTLAAGLLAGAVPPAGAQAPIAPPDRSTAPKPAAPAPAAATTPAAARVVWKRAGTMYPPESPAPAGVRAAAETPVPDATPLAVPAVVPAPDAPVPPIPATLPGVAPAKPEGVKPAAAPGTIKPGMPFAPVVWKGKPAPAGPGNTPVHSRMDFMPKPFPPLKPSPTPKPGWKARGQDDDDDETKVILQPPTPAPNPPGAVPPGPAPGGKPPAAAKPPPKFHGHKYPVQPFAPPGAVQVPPTDAGFYTLLAMIQGEEQEKPPRWPYPRGGPIPPSFAEFDFSYLDSIPPEDRDWAERLHRVPVGDHWLVSTGGEIRYRYNYESNTRLSGVNSTYDLIRTRAYADVWYEDAVRGFMEFYFGDTAYQDFPPYPRDVNRGDIQQLFVDVKAGEWDGNPAYVRGGRQELLYGSQRLVSTVDWGNNRTRFDGVKAFYRSAKVDVDAFAVRPTTVKPDGLDTWDTKQVFSGVWATYKPKKGTFVDGYYLNLDNVNRNVARGQRRSGGFNVSTFGSRYYSRSDNGLLVDLEGMLQFGHHADQTILAQAFHTYLGWYFKDVWATPTVWAGYDYASGDPDPNNTGQRRTFNQLFQFGHYYYGFIDITGGQNVRNFNVQAYAYPAHWLTAGAQYHVFRLDSNKDALYNAAGVPIRRDPTGRAGNDIGSELDLLLNFHLTDRQDVFLNYCHFFPGDFIRATSTARAGVPLDYVYAQYSLRW